MIKKLLSLAVLLSAANLHAQITLNQAAHTPIIGSSFNYHQAVSYSHSAGSGGANQTWDLSNITGSSLNIDFIAPANSTEPSNYPDATIVEEIGGFAENYYRKTSTELSLEGQFIPGQARIIYSDRREMMKFPMNYQDSHNETFAGTVNNLGVGQVFDRTGTIEMVADGYGDLILPYGTVSNVLRIRLVFDYSDTYTGVPFFSYTDTVCMWFNPGTQNFVASTTNSYTNGMLSISTGSYIDQADLSTSGVGLTENPALREVLSFAPNPSKGQITIYNESPKAAQFEIIDFSGSLYHSSEISSGQSTMDLSHLNSGVYLVRYIQDGAMVTEKLIIE